jgi:hypothetical protein
MLVVFTASSNAGSLHYKPSTSRAIRALGNRNITCSCVLYSLFIKDIPDASEDVETLTGNIIHASRNQEWAFNQHNTAARAGAVDDHGPPKGLVQDMILRNKVGKPTSQLSDVMGASIATNLRSSAAATTSTAVPRPDGAMVGSINWIGSSSRPLTRTTSSAVTNGFEQGDHSLSFRWRGTAGASSNGKTSTTIPSSEPAVVREAGSPLVVRSIVYISISINTYYIHL